MLLRPPRIRHCYSRNFAALLEVSIAFWVHPRLIMKAAIHSGQFKISGCVLVSGPELVAEVL